MSPTSWGRGTKIRKIESADRPRPIIFNLLRQNERLQEESEEKISITDKIRNGSITGHSLEEYSRDGTKTVSSKTKTETVTFKTEPKTKTVNSTIKTTQDSRLLFNLPEQGADSEDIYLITKLLYCSCC